MTSTSEEATLGRVVARRHVFDDLVRFETELWGAVDQALRAEAELALSWFEPMTIMSRLEACRVHDIAEALSLTVGGTSKLVDRIEAAGLCVRRLNPDDRRSSLISLTPAGEQRMADAEVVFDDQLARWFDLPESALDRFHRVLRQLRVKGQETRHG
jgi:DNA-binding MarR family transcriptional regulator